jgi:hypothetical protein
VAYRMIHRWQLRDDINQLKREIRDLERVLYSAGIITTTEELGLDLYISKGHFPTSYIVKPEGKLTARERDAHKSGYEAGYNVAYQCKTTPEENKK